MERLRGELKAWEARFEAEHGRPPGRLDVQSRPAIRVMYKDYKEMKASAMTAQHTASKEGCSGHLELHFRSREPDMPGKQHASRGEDVCQAPKPEELQEANPKHALHCHATERPDAQEDVASEPRTSFQLADGMQVRLQLRSGLCTVPAEGEPCLVRAGCFASISRPHGSNLLLWGRRHCTTKTVPTLDPVATEAISSDLRSGSSACSQQPADSSNIPTGTLLGHEQVGMPSTEALLESDRQASGDEEAAPVSAGAEQQTQLQGAEPLRSWGNPFPLQKTRKRKGLKRGSQDGSEQAASTSKCHRMRSKSSTSDNYVKLNLNGRSKRRYQNGTKDQATADVTGPEVSIMACSLARVGLAPVAVRPLVGMHGLSSCQTLAECVANDRRRRSWGRGAEPGAHGDEHDAGEVAGGVEALAQESADHGSDQEGRGIGDGDGEREAGGGQRGGGEDGGAGEVGGQR
eukprot:SM000222S07003  [mRNA]  locus=s222:100142:103401:- [translate_table: standard]